MDNQLLALLRKLPLDPKSVTALLPLLGKHGAAGVAMLARGYLGPLASRATSYQPAAASVPRRLPVDRDPIVRDPGDNVPLTGTGSPTGATSAATSPGTDHNPPTGTASNGNESTVEGGVLHVTSPLTPVDPPRATNAATSGRVAASDGDVLCLALNKLVYELGELALHNPTLAADGKQPEFTLDDHGNPPAMSVMHAIAAVRWWQARAEQQAVDAAAKTAAADAALARSPRARLQAARTERYATAPRYSYVAPISTYRVPR
jgi:hypothetical protein